MGAAGRHEAARLTHEHVDEERGVELPPGDLTPGPAEGIGVDVELAAGHFAPSTAQGVGIDVELSAGDLAPGPAESVGIDAELAGRDRTPSLGEAGEAGEAAGSGGEVSHLASTFRVGGSAATHAEQGWVRRALSQVKRERPDSV